MIKAIIVESEKLLDEFVLSQAARAGFNMKEISADKGYISADNLQTAVDHGATPYIPFKTNTTGKSGSEL